MGSAARVDREGAGAHHRVPLEDGQPGRLDVVIRLDNLDGQLPEAVSRGHQVGGREGEGADDHRHQVLAGELGRHVPALADHLARVLRIGHLDDALGAERASLRVGGVRRHRTERSGHQAVEEADLGDDDFAMAAAGRRSGRAVEWLSENEQAPETSQLPLRGKYDRVCCAVCEGTRGLRLHGCYCRRDAPCAGRAHGGPCA